MRTGCFSIGLSHGILWGLKKKGPYNRGYIKVLWVFSRLPGSTTAGIQKLQNDVFLDPGRLIPRYLAEVWRGHL